MTVGKATKSLCEQADYNFGWLWVVRGEQEQAMDRGRRDTAVDKDAEEE